MKKRVYASFGVSISVLLIYLYLIQDFTKTPPTLYFNGKIITINDQNPEAEAMVVVNGKIEAIGLKKDLEPLVKQNTIKVDLNGATVLPGFIDPHTHFALSMFMIDMHDLSGFKHPSNSSVWQAFEGAVKQTEKGHWVIGKGIDPVLVPDLMTPSLEYLDKVAPDNPVILFSQSLHNYWINSKAFDLAGISKETPNPSKHSYYAKNNQGELTGLVVEQDAIQPIFEILSKEVLTPELLTQTAVKTMRHYAKHGNTTIVSTGLSIKDDKPLVLLKHLSAQNPSILGSLLGKIGMLPARAQNLRHFIYMRHDLAHLLPKTKTEDDFYNIIGLKFWYDGSPYIGSMYLNKPYLSNKFTREKLYINPNHQGKALIQKDTFKNLIQDFHKKGWQIAIHTQGDAAIGEVLDIFEELSEELDFDNLRHRLEHCLLLPSGDLGRVKKINLSPSFHINHLYYYGDALRKDILGEQRAETLLPLASTGQIGIKYSLHADQPMFESKPFRLIQTAIERKTKSGDVIATDQRIKLLEAIKALTIDAAWQIHMEKKIGSLEKGKYADFIILDRNPFDTPSSELENIQCLKTYVNGNLIIQH